MAGKSVSFNTHCNLSESQLESVAKWLSCNGEVWGMGPTAVFASAAALFLYNELQATLFEPGDHVRVTAMEKTLVSTMILGMLALMIHLWVCSMRFFQYYLDTLIKDSPNMLLEMTTAGLLGGQSEIVPLGPLTRFLRQQQPQIHITVCWFLSLCYADYVRKHYCQRFNMPYLDQWQAELHERASRGLHRTMDKVNSFVGAVHQRLRGYNPGLPPNMQTSDAHTGGVSPRRPSTVEVSRATSRVSWALAARRSDGCGQSDCGQSESSLHCDRQRPPAEMCVRLLGQSSETTADAIEKLRAYVKLMEWARCGDSSLSMVPTAVWAVGSAALAHRLLSALFRRYIFRRVPLWELILQHLLFVWMVIYSIHFWVVLVGVVKIFVEYCYEIDENSVTTNEDIQSQKIMQQWIIWMFGAIPLSVFIQTRPRPVAPPLMIWITTSPWLRREMGPYGYYLNRPFPELESASETVRHQALTLRRAFSDSKTVIKEPRKKRRNSKSV